MSRALLRNPDLLLAWTRGELWIEDLETKRRWKTGPEVVTLLDAFGEPRSVAEAARLLSGRDDATVQRAARRLQKAGLLLPALQARRRPSRIDAWKGNVASAQYHVATRDLPYVGTPAETVAYLRKRLETEARPPQFRRRRGAVVALPRDGVAAAPDADGLMRVLLARRTVRQFRDQRVELRDLAALVTGTWGQTGWLEGGILGRAPTRTSPSAGALHPIECYILAWRVRGLAPGVYHYDVPADALRRLRKGSPRAEAVKAASGQEWLREAAFLCIMTGVFTRRLWKYQAENAYRALWLDAGHLGQTFALLATARGLGAFTTAAIQHTRIERLLGLDGITEFPVYLCGAGVPDPGRRFPSWRPLVR